MALGLAGAETAVKNGLDPDRLFPADPASRNLAAQLYAGVKDLPIISPHGHTDPRWFAENEAFPDPAQLFIVPDHYVFRMLFSQGIDLAELGVPRADGGLSQETDSREDLAPVRGELPPLPGNTLAHVAGARLPGGLRLDKTAFGPDRGRSLRSHRRLPDPAGVPPARAVRAVQHRGDRHDGIAARRPEAGTA